MHIIAALYLCLGLVVTGVADVPDVRGQLRGPMVKHRREPDYRITGMIAPVPLRVGDGALWRETTPTEQLAIYIRKGPTVEGDNKFERFKTSRTDDPHCLRAVDNLGNVLVPVQDTIPSKWALGASRASMPTDDPDCSPVDVYVFAAPPAGATKVEFRFPKGKRLAYDLMVSDMQRNGREASGPAAESLVKKGPLEVSVDSAVWATRTIRRDNGRQDSGVLTLAITVRNVGTEDTPRVAALEANQCVVTVGKTVVRVVDAVGAPKSDGSRVLRPKQSHTTYLNVECGHPSITTDVSVVVRQGWAGLKQDVELKVPAAHLWWIE